MTPAADTTAGLREIADRLNEACGASAECKWKPAHGALVPVDGTLGMTIGIQPEGGRIIIRAQPAPFPLKCQEERDYHQAWLDAASRSRDVRTLPLITVKAGAPAQTIANHIRRRLVGPMITLAAKALKLHLDRSAYREASEAWRAKVCEALGIEYQPNQSSDRIYVRGKTTIDMQITGTTLTILGLRLTERELPQFAALVKALRKQ